MKAAVRHRTCGLLLCLSGFDGFAASWPVEIHYTQGQAYKVVARGSEEAFSMTDISVIGGKLSIKRKKDSYQSDANKHTITLYVTAPAVNSIQNNARMDFTAQSLKTDGLAITNNGSAYVQGRCGGRQRFVGCI